MDLLWTKLAPYYPVILKIIIEYNRQKLTENQLFQKKSKMNHRSKIPFHKYLKRICKIQLEQFIFTNYVLFSSLDYYYVEIKPETINTLLSNHFKFGRTVNMDNAFENCQRALVQYVSPRLLDKAYILGDVVCNYRESNFFNQIYLATI